MPERVDMWKGVLIIAIVALVLVFIVGGAYFLLFVWPFGPDVGSNGDEPALTREEQIRENIRSLTAPTSSNTTAPDGTSAPAKANPTLTAPAAAPASSVQQQGEANINSLTAP